MVITAGGGDNEKRVTQYKEDGSFRELPELKTEDTGMDAHPMWMGKKTL